MTTLGITCESRGALGIVAPLALAAAAGTALVVDLDPDGPRYPGESSLAELVSRGPRLAELRPGREGIAVLRNGGVGLDQAAEVVAALAKGWPNTVLRLPSGRLEAGVPAVPVVPLLPEGMTPRIDRPAVYQQMGWREKAPGPAITLPTPSRATVAALLGGRLPRPSRWLSSWRTVWELPWV